MKKRLFLFTLILLLLLTLIPVVGCQPQPTPPTPPPTPSTMPPQRPKPTGAETVIFPDENLEADKEKLTSYCKNREQLASLAKAEIKLGELCKRVRQNLAECSLELKRLALDALDIQVTVTPERVDIKGVIPIDITTAQAPSNILTTGRTSA